jgi:F-type H+-transporting ATPase subunit gamma
MVESLKLIKSRIRSIENTVKITRAMEMVSIVKLRQSENALADCRRYYLAMNGLKQDLFSSLETARHPFLKWGKTDKPDALCVVTSDTGLCGTYNMSVIRAAEEYSAVSSARNTIIVAAGRKGAVYFKKKQAAVPHIFSGMNGRYSAAAADEIAEKLSRLFLSGEAGRVSVAHMHFESLLRYRPAVTELLPVEREIGHPRDCMLEPGGRRILDELMPRYIRVKVRLMLAESFIAEHACRMMAMKAASDNAKELRELLVLRRNKARQAAITGEMIEIVSAAGGK